MERLLGWDVVGVVVPFLAAIGLGVLALANYRWAKVYFALSGVILATKLALVTAPVWPEAGWLIAGYLAIVAALVVTFQRVDLLELRDSTRLMPGRLPTPRILENSEIVPDDALLVFWGPTVAWSNQMPHTILQMDGKPMLTVDRDRRGLVIKVLRIFDDSNRIIARIDEDGFWVEPSTRKGRPDRSTLVVYDRTDTEVLRMTLLNRKALSVTGVFRAEGVPTVVLTPETMRVGTNTFRVGMIANCNVDFDIRR
jgi:hypothetical protein